MKSSANNCAALKESFRTSDGVTIVRFDAFMVYPQLTKHCKQCLCIMSESENNRRFHFTQITLFFAMACTMILGFGIRCVPLVFIIWVVLNLWKTEHSNWAIAVVVVFLSLMYFGVGRSVDVRLDTGDQRIVQWGIPVDYRPMYEPARSSLLKLKMENARIEWCWCAKQDSSNRPDRMMYNFYAAASAWGDVNPEIARLVVRDIAFYMQTTHANRGLPDYFSMISFDVIDRTNGVVRIADGWQKNPQVLDYLTEKGFDLSIIKKVQ